VNELLIGAAGFGSLAIALFFLRFWRESRDRLFLAFAVAFVIFAANRLVIGLSDRESEELAAVYGLRALAFLVIIVAIVDRNRRP